MKICLVTTFPPSHAGLSEYGFHIARELQRNPALELTILADRLSEAKPELEGFRVLRCWSFNDPRSPLGILRTLKQCNPDVVWFNLLFSTFGRNPLVAFGGLMTPLLARLSGRYSHVTLHHLMDTIDLDDARVRFPGAYRMAGAVATRMILLSNSVSVLMPGYRRILHERYGRDNVHLRAHGILCRRPEYPDFSQRGNPAHRILAFGKWGTYKRLELMLEAFSHLAEAVPEAKLIVAGGNHPHMPGYVESVAEQHKDNPRIAFTGYVPEEDVPPLFQSASVVVMPYSSSTGCSGVAHLACAYGVPIVCSDLPDFRQMADGENLAIEFHEPGNAQELARCLANLLRDPERQFAMARQNFSAALRMTMPEVVHKYIRHFDLQRRSEALRSMIKVRRLPGWLPSKSRVLRIIAGNALSWLNRPAVPPSILRSPTISVKRNGNGSRRVDVPGITIDQQRVVAPGANGNGLHAGTSAATEEKHPAPDNTSHDQRNRASA